MNKLDLEQRVEPVLGTKLEERNLCITAKEIIVDITGGLLFYTPLMTGVEFASGMNSEEVLKSRIYATVFWTIALRPYTKFREWYAKKLKADYRSSRIKKFLTDTSAMIAFQAPIYTATLYCAGASLIEALITLPSNLSLTAVTARPFGYFLDKWRKYWGTKPTLDA